MPSLISRLIPSSLRGECLLGFRSLDSWRAQGKIDYDLYKGNHYGIDPSGGFGITGRLQPVNLHQQLIRTLVPFLAMNAPLSDVTPKHIDLQFEAELRKDIYDAQAEELRLSEVYQDAATDAILRGISFTLNVVKSGGDRYTARQTSLDMGKEACRLIDLDDISIDPLCKIITADKRFIAHRYTVDRQDAIDSIADGCYGAVPEDYDDGQMPNDNIASPEEATEIIESLAAIEDAPYRADRVDQNDGETRQGYERMGETICLWDVVLFVHGQVWIVTLPGDPSMSNPFPTGSVDKFLACYRWNGPPSGPINVLAFLRVPFNKMPLALAAMQRDLAEVIDILSNKTFRQLLRTKTLTIYEGSAENMAMTMRKSSEGGYIRGNPNSVKTVQDGGLIPEMMPGTQYFRDEWQNAVGNLALASGTGDTGKTATAFEGLMSRVQGFLDFLRSKVEQLATDDLRVRARFLSQNPVFKQRMQKSVGQGASAVAIAMNVMNPQGPGAMTPPGAYMLQGDHDDFDLKTRAFSMSYSSPTIQAQMLMKALAETIPDAMQTGLDPRPILSILSRVLNEPEIEELIPDPITMQMQAQEAAMATAIAGDPTGQGGQDYQPDQGPAGRRVPGGARQESRAMRPGPGQGSPRPMGMAMNGAAA